MGVLESANLFELAGELIGESLLHTQLGAEALATGDTAKAMEMAGRAGGLTWAAHRIMDLVKESA